MPTHIKDTLTFTIGDFDPAVLAYLIGAKIFVEVHAQTPNGNPVLRRTAAGVLAGAERWQEFEEETRSTSSYWPCIHFEHGFTVKLSLEQPDSVVKVNIL